MLMEDDRATARMEDKLGFIQRVLHMGDYDVAVKECCTLFEIVFRKIFQQALVALPFQDRQAVLEAERKVGKGTKGVQDFGFGELVGLFRECGLMDKWSKHTGRDLGIIQTLNYNEIVNLRNRITHKGATCSRGEANVVFEYLRNMLAVLGFAELDNSIHQSFRQETPAAQEKEEASAPKLPVIRKRELRQSAYAPTDPNEAARLAVQGNNYRSLDIAAFERALERLERKDGLVALDVGCAGGEVTRDRFDAFSAFSGVVGVDKNEAKIAEAAAAGDGAAYAFVAADIEEDGFDEALAQTLRERGLGEAFDFIFSALTIHHLANPVKALVKLRRWLKPGGVLVLRGSDDGSKLAYPDEQGLVPSIIAMTARVEGASDRENGRKLYTQLWKSGFRDVQMKYEVKDTAGKSLDSRLQLFRGSFSYRINNFKKRLDREPNHPTYIEEYRWMKDALEELELEFMNDAFYYQETIYAAIARKS
ncbi:class I SAM-dependent methyltransferase [Paenibacillus sp.]|uniref:class I SAM-dependent methyltransferase n=1 Tax=Paenibacillus sp. TaxID=58172 RepID=UPI002D499FCC|nr:class I SAM-dependent methyltransferase [Paenibacillus sp.]HZG86001.1 class I SAM-dependent methyltransferase [Paenibacillus sp.]